MTLSNTDIITRAQEVLEREAQAVQALAAQMAESDGNPLMEVLDLLINCQGHVLVTGAGTSHAMAQRFAHLLSCSGRPALCISAADALHGASGAITPNDVVFIISKGGHSTEVNQFAAIARERGAKLIAQTENPDSPLGRMSDAVYYVKTRSDIVDPYGMIATGSSLVNGAAGDVLCVLLVELGEYSQEAFGKTHPGGAVGKKLTEEHREASL